VIDSIYFPVSHFYTSREFTFQLSFPLISKIELLRPSILRTLVKALRRSTRYRGIVRTIYVTGYQKFFRDEVPSIVIAPDGIGDTRGAQLFPSPLTLYPPCFRKF